MKSFYKSLIISASLFFLFLFAFLFVNLKQIRPAYAATCTYSFPNSVTSGANFTVTINGLPGDFFTAAIINTTNNSVVSQKTGQNTFGSTVTINFTAPASGTPYAILANGSSITNGTYTCTSGNTTLTVNAASGGSGTVNIIVSNLQASFVDVGPGLFTWTPSGSTAGRLFIGTNSADPIVGSTISYAVNTADGSLGVPQPPVGVYYAAMYTGAFGEIRMSNIVSFAIGAAGGIKMNQPTISGNTVIFTFTPSDGAFVVIADTNCPAMLSVPRKYDSGQLAPGTTQATFSGAAAGIYCAKIVKALSGETLSSVIYFEVLTGTATGGTSCSGFFGCITGIQSPTAAFSENGFIGALFSSILPIAIGLGGFLSVIIIVISGIQFIASNGNPESAAAARSRLIFAVVGLALLILAFAITQIVDKVFLRGSGVL